MGGQEGGQRAHEEEEEGRNNQSTETWKMRNYGANKSEAGGEMRVWEKNRKEG